MRIRALKPLAAVLLLAVSAPGHASGDRSWDPASLQALRLRETQILLQVGALRCRATNPEIVRAYNRFVERARERLVRAEEQLVRHFGLETGRAAYDRFITEVANRHSEGMQAAGRCLVIARMLETDDASGGGFAEVLAALPVLPMAASAPCRSERAETVAARSPFDPLPE